MPLAIDRKVISRPVSDKGSNDYWHQIYRFHFYNYFVDSLLEREKNRDTSSIKQKKNSFIAIIEKMAQKTNEDYTNRLFGITRPCRKSGRPLM